MINEEIWEILKNHEGKNLLKKKIKINGYLVEFEIEEDDVSKLKKWGSGEGLADNTPLSDIIVYLINKTVKN